jgi:ribosomal protein L35AE/L33A
MKNIIGVLFLLLGTLSVFSQRNSYYKKGDTLYYKNNRATYLKTDTFIVIKGTNSTNNNSFLVEKHQLDTELNTYILASKFTTNGLHQLKTNGLFESYHKNGKIATSGQTVSGTVGNGIWTYYYKNGEKKSEKKLSQTSFFNNAKVNLMINFWDKEGNQTVKNGKGFAKFKLKHSNIFNQGKYKNGLKHGFWTAFIGQRKIYKEKYNKGKLINGKSWNTQGVAFSYKKLKTNPFFRRRDNATVKKYIETRFDSGAASIIGDFIVNFTVTKEGQLEEKKIIKELASNYNKEIIEIISTMDHWTPAKKRGQNIDATFTFELNFN